jgi:lactoylglutathione lyase
MKIHITHIAVFALDIEKTKDFYVTYFGGKSNELYGETKAGFSSYFISFDGGVCLEVMHYKDLEKRPIIDKSNGWSHIAFSVGSRENVIQLTEEITSAGYQLYSAPRVTGDGYFESCVADPDGNRVEITI